MAARGDVYTWPSLTAEQLRDDAALGRLVAELVQQGVLPAAPVTWFRCWAAAEHALAWGRDPGALFRWLIEGRHWSRISATEDDRGAARVRRWRGRCRRLGAPSASDPVRLAEGDLASLLRRLGLPASVPVAPRTTDKLG